MRGQFVWSALDQARALNLEWGGQDEARPGQDGITRRRVLAAMTAGAAGLAVPACFQPSNASRIAVVGGGLAGLAALHRLRARGTDVTLFEARGAAGGRTRSVRGVFAPDYAWDEGGQLVDSTHADMIGLTRELKLTLIDRRSFGAEQEIQIGAHGTIAERDLAERLRAIAAQITSDSDRLDADYDAVAREIDALSVARYLDRHDLARGAARDALEAGIRAEYGVEPEHASAIELLFNLPTVDGTRVTRLSLSDERYLVDGGAGQVAARLAELHRPAIRLNKRLSSIVLDGPAAQLGFADGEKATFDHVVLALPAPIYREIRIEGALPDLWRALFAEIALGRNEKLIAGYDRATWRETIGAGGALWATDGFTEAWDAASGAGREGPGAICYFLGGDQVTAAGTIAANALADRFTDMAHAALPTLPKANGRIRRTRWCDDPLSKGAYINYRPGQLTRFGSLFTLEEEGEARPSQAGPLYFAGEWLSDAWPGYMNGAAQTGRIAADAIIAQVKAKKAA